MPGSTKVPSAVEKLLVIANTCASVALGQKTEPE